MTDLEKLVAKEAIRDQICVYAHAIDRIDNAALRTVFAEDSQVDYGNVFKGRGWDWIEFMMDQHRGFISTHHVMTNCLIKLSEDGTKAASETYMYAADKTRNPKDPTKPGRTIIARCRDVDKWEKRDGKWLIVQRIVAGDNTFMVDPGKMYLEDYNNGRDGVLDPSDEYFASIK